ncbi:MAG TPA: hypothetical protein PK297_03410 [Spirochaetota bacterium]|mgnify:CR=1 FL=1|nr:hypothetical protein [Spirochaetota bacterium]
MKHLSVVFALIILLALGVACGKSEDRTEDAIKAAGEIIKKRSSRLTPSRQRSRTSKPLRRLPILSANS